MTVASVETADGLALAYEQAGDLNGPAVFWLHGTPGSRLGGRHPDLTRIREAGIRLITYDRPGYGRSSRHRGRKVVDCVGDVAAIADHLGIERFVVSGGSGGGPHALAVGARMPERVIVVGCEVGAAPFHVPDLDWFEGMDPANVREFEWALAGEETLARELQREADTALEKIDEDPTAVLSEMNLPATDLAILEDPGVRESLRASTREEFFNGVWGWVDDDLAFTWPWGFDVSELRVPVQIRYGAADVLVPRGHGDWLARNIAHAEVTVDKGGGHLTAPDEHLEVLRALAGA